jgi:hypothetical protein
MQVIACRACTDGALFDESARFIDDRLQLGGLLALDAYAEVVDMKGPIGLAWTSFDMRICISEGPKLYK